MLAPIKEKTSVQFGGLLDSDQANHTAFGVSADETVVSTEAYERRDFNRSGIRVGGALVVRAQIDGLDGLRVSEVIIDDEHRPLDEESIARYGLEAHIRVQRDPDAFIHRSLPDAA